MLVRSTVGRAVGIAALGGLLLAGSAGCGFVGAHDTDTHGADSTGTATTSDGVQTITVIGDSKMSFTPNIIKAHTGKLVITLQVTSPTPHDLAVRSLHANTGMVKKGKPASVTVDLSHTGRYDFVCTYHEKEGMTGVIEVS